MGIVVIGQDGGATTTIKNVQLFDNGQRGLTATENTILIDSVVTGNGIGIVQPNGGQLTISGSQVNGNDHRGVGIAEGSLTAIDSTFNDNGAESTAATQGNGIRVQDGDGSATVVQSEICGNRDSPFTVGGSGTLVVKVGSCEDSTLCACECATEAPTAAPTVSPTGTVGKKGSSMG